MHASKVVFVLVDRAPCSVLLGIGFLMRRVTLGRVVLLLNARLADVSIRFFNGEFKLRTILQPIVHVSQDNCLSDFYLPDGSAAYPVSLRDTAVLAFK